MSVHRVPCLHVEGSETFVTEILPYTHAVISVTHSWVAVLSMHCDAVFRHGGMYTVGHM